MLTEPEHVDWDELERRGHEFTLVAPMHIGRSTYWCEYCGCVLVVLVSRIVVAAAPRGHEVLLGGSFARCVRPNPRVVPIPHTGTSTDLIDYQEQRPLKLSEQLAQLDAESLRALRERD